METTSYTSVSPLLDLMNLKQVLLQQRSSSIHAVQGELHELQEQIAQKDQIITVYADEIALLRDRLKASLAENQSLASKPAVQNTAMEDDLRH
jgi:hypothetical protein